MIKLFLFDLGGVIIEVHEEKYFRYLSSINKVSPDLTRAIINRSGQQLELGRMDLSKFQAEIGKELGIPGRKIGWFTFFKKHATLDKGTMAIVKSLKDNYKIAFLSNVDKWRYNFIVKRMFRDVLHLFDYKFASFALGMVKPSPMIYKKVLKDMHMKPSEVIFIDNNLNNVVGARSVGIRSLQFTNSKKLKLDLKKLRVKLN